ncbi:MAG: hypothetical protein ACRD12_20170 [Acidimicrobiales bacterium]
MRTARVGPRLVAGVAAACLLVVGATTPAGAKSLDLSLCAPTTNTFTLGGNDFFPMAAGRVSYLRGAEEGQTIGLRITVLPETEPLTFGSSTVVARVVEEFEWNDVDGNGAEDAGEPRIELARNYFATTAAGGTVCYFGEAVDNYVDGVVADHQGSWRADDPGAAPGIFMPAAPKAGMQFAQESDPGVAEDQAAIVGTGDTTVPAGTFRDTIRVRETNPLDGDKGFKVYARDVGLVLDAPPQLYSVTG